MRALIFFLAAASARADETALSQALRLLSRPTENEAARGQAFAQLESFFAKTEANFNDRADAARVLAWADESELKNHPPHFYAGWLLDASARLPRPLSKIEERRLLRLRADGLFAEQNLEAAQEKFLELRRLGEPADQAYAEYKLGWIELNRDQALAASDRWLRLLRNPQSGQFRPLLLQDSARLLPELSPPLGERRRQELWAEWARDSSGVKSEDLAQAVFEGLLRLRGSPEKKKFFAERRRQWLEGPVGLELAKRGLSELESGGDNSPESACEVLDGVTERWAAEVDAENLRAELRRCRQALLQKSLSLAQKKIWSPRFEHFLLSLPATHSLAPEAVRWFELQSRFGEACARSFVLAEAGQVDGASLSRSCLRALKDQTTSGTRVAEALTKLLSSGRLGSKQVTDKWFLELVAGALVQKDFAKLWAEEVLHHPAWFQQSPHPLLLAEQAAVEPALQSYDHAWLAAFAPKPLPLNQEPATKTWLALLSRQKDLSADELESLVPLTSLDGPQALSAPRSLLWMRWALGQAEKNPLRQSYLAAERKRALQAGYPGELRWAGLSLILENEGPLAAWKQLDAIAAADPVAVARPEPLREALQKKIFAKSFELKLEDFAPRSALVQREWALLTKARGHENLSSGELRELEKREPRLASSLQALAHLEAQSRKLGALQWKDAQELARPLSRALSELGGMMKKLQAQSWFSEGLRDQGVHIVGESLTNLSQRLEKTPLPPRWGEKERQLYAGQLQLILTRLGQLQASLRKASEGKSG